MARAIYGQMSLITPRQGRNSYFGTSIGKQFLRPDETQS